VGVDGCRAGWIAVAMDGRGQAAFTVLPRIEAVIAWRPARAMIDMPIGLPETGYRACDLAARRMLGAARSRVFLGARRPLLAHLGDYPAANAWAKSDGKGLSIECFHLLKKIAEIDAVIAPALQDSLLEAHPELVFQRLNGGAALPPKRLPEGLRQRRALLAAAGFDALDGWIASLRGSGAAPDDLFDACVLALAARAPGGPVACAAETDARGLRMEIWY
jgi:predicted RNase H-like nuclease